MGTLGKYLHDAREARGIDLRDAAQQTRISLQYLRALEEENFEKLPGDVFVRGFLKNYARFLRLDETEVMKQYAEMVQKPVPAGVANQVQEAAEKHEKPRR
ncbi:MAG TPA: helix-turn-helix domain-containing protein, partial [Nitrospirota bacterium]|nr:helix-turn-helix domain-containing protein [Nitrospirota bacterium]